ncbi:MAG: ribosome-associated protein [Alphaproteobacteria bacterium]
MTDNLIETADSTALSPDGLLAEIQKILDDHLAEDVIVIDLKGKSTIGDYMVIASGRSSRQVVTMAQFLSKHLKKTGINGIRPEGMGQGDWVLIDAGDVIVHLFRPEVREFYSLEKMWEADLTDAEMPN